MKGKNRYTSTAFKTIDQLIDDAAELFPDEPAVIAGNQQLSYRDLIGSSNQVGNYLQHLNIKPDQIAAICLDRSPELIISILGVLKAGGAYLPLDPTYPPARLEQIVNDSMAPFLITTSNILFQKFQKFQGSVILYDKIAATTLPTSLPIRQHNANSLAYVIYTSGSTGKPKGVLIEHIGIPSMISYTGTVMAASNRSRLLQFASISFDAASNDIFVALAHGASLIMPAPGSIMISSELQEFICAFEITHLTCPAGVLATLDPNNICKLQTVVSAGELASDNLLNVWNEKVTLLNAYGPTEVTVTSAIAAYSKFKGARNIGKAMPNLKFYIVDENLCPVEKGARGELCISGIGVARGYLNDPTKTAKAFIDNPFVNDEERRNGFCMIYRTGDACRFADDDDVEFIGRIDTQIKINGYRIELSEIENQLSQNPLVRATVAIVKKSKNGNKCINAFISPSRDIGNVTTSSLDTNISILKGRDWEIQSEELAMYLKQRLPYYMLPSRFFFVESFPVNSNGKIQRNLLAALDLDQLDNEMRVNVNSHDEPTSLLERKLVEIWTEVLNVIDVGLDDDFFHRGGNSLLAVLATRLIRDRLDLHLPSHFMYEKPTVRQLASFIETGDYARPGYINFFKEAILDLEMPKYEDQFTIPDPLTAENIFFTGATGYIGAYLLGDLLRMTKAHFYCLVRGETTEIATNRLIDVLKRYKIWKASFDEQARITVVVGDLGKTKLGLSDQDYDIMAHKISVIYHAAADVNYAKPYSSLKASIVTGTQRILKFAVAKQVKSVHYISTIGVFGCSHNFNQIEEFTEDMDIDFVVNSIHVEIGYDQAKWVAEQMAIEARKRGCLIGIYRPGFAAGHSKTGILNVADFWARMVKGCAKMGYYPALDNERMDLCTVDYISEAIAKISVQKEAIGRTFHITPPTLEENVTSNEFFESIAESAPMMPVPYAQWIEHLMAYYKNDPIDNPLLPLVSMLTNKVYNDRCVLEMYQRMPHKNSRNTTDMLRLSPVLFTPTRETTYKYVEHLLK